MELILKARIAAELQRREFASDEEKKLIDKNVSNLAARIRKLKSL
jgi:hypothetical protein